MKFENREGLAEFNFELKDRRLEGASAMVRVKNEEETLEASITSIEPFVDEIVIVDNASTDLTNGVMEKLSRKFPEKVKTYYYPFAIKKCGQEFQNADPNSVHSLAYYYNWCKSKCTFAFLLKWDADMLIGVGQRKFWSDIRSRILQGHCIFLRPKARLIVGWGGKFYIAKDEPFGEPKLYPNLESLYYIKLPGENTERIGYDGRLLVDEIPDFLDDCRTDLSEINYFELKLIEKNEFSHWDEETLADLEKIGGNRQTRLQYQIFSNPDRYVENGTLKPFQDPILDLVGREQRNSVV